MKKNNIRKCAGFTSFITSGILVLSGCGLSNVDKASNENSFSLNTDETNSNFANNVDIVNEYVSEFTENATAKPYAYAGAGYKEYLESMTENTTEEPYAYAGAGYKEYLESMTESTTEEPYAYAGAGYKEYLESMTENTTEEPYAYAGAGYKEYLESMTENTTEEPYAYAGAGYKEYLESMTENTTEEPYAYAGQYEYLNNMNINVYSYDSTGKYVYYDSFDFYSVSDGETIEDICQKLNITYEQFKEYNPYVSDISNVNSIIYPIKIEFYSANAGEMIDSIAIQNGIDVEKIKDYASSNGKVESDCLINLHVFVGNETSYDTYVGKSNVIYNNKIWGDKIVYGSGKGGASQNLFVLNNSRFVYGTNDVISYSFDGAGNYVSTVVCKNASDINSMYGIPVAYFRTDDEVLELASQLNCDVDLLQFKTENISNYPVCCDNNGNCFVAYSGMSFNNDVTKTK